eukprot:GHUV01015614.1.p1 GENE.GHUV01015614.1~~GHUV01015614.1.p1  ORF type:complete len:348 (+),score=161.67 GHUV01015614.1:659-1702(+)
MARIRQQEEAQAAAMQAKLGIPRSASAGNLGNSSASEDTLVGKGSSKKRRQSCASAAAGTSSEAEEASAAAAGKQQRKKSKKGAEGASSQQQQQQWSDQEAAAAAAAVRKAPIVVVVDIKGAGPNVEAFKAFKQTPATGWWGAKMFTSAGLLESIEDEQKQRQRTTFDEDMQTRVYMAAHDAQRQGKKGLGKSTTLNIAGGSWQGKKVKFDQEAADGADTAVAVEQPGSAQQQQEQQTDPAATSSSPSSAGPAASDREMSNQAGPRNGKKKKDSSKPGKVKWAKLAVRHLQDVPGGVLKWSKLWKQLKQAAQKQQVGVEGSCKERAWRKLQGCSHLQVTGKLVSLAA